jgi:hypothetical protein
VVADIGDKLITAHPIGSLPNLDETLAFSDAQKEEIAKQQSPAISEGPHALLPMSKLTPAQRAFVQAFAAKVNAAHNQPILTTDDKIELKAEPQILLMVPSAPDPISLSAYCGCWQLYQPSDKLSQQMTPAAPASTAPPANPSPAPAPGPLLAAYPRRAVYAAPRTAAEVDALMNSMKALGLNALYLDVFSGGHAHIPASDLPHDAFKARQTDILTEALKRSKETGIAVLPTLDLLRWGTDAPEEVRDLTILGETSSQALAWQALYVAVAYQGRTLEDAQKDLTPSSVFVSPSAEKVRDGLTAFVKDLAAKPDVGGIVFRDTVTPGYDRPANSHYLSDRSSVGYTVPLRLAFLRQEHVDPVDLVDLNSEWYFGDVFVDLPLPEFDDDGKQGDASLQRWYGYRNTVNVEFMRSLFDAAQSSAPHQVWVAQRRRTDHGDWYALWDKRDGPLPEIPDDLVDEYNNPDRNFASLAHTQSPLAVTAVTVQEGETPEALAYTLKDIKPGWDGIVLACQSDPRGDSLKKLITSPVAVKPSPR